MTRSLRQTSSTGEWLTARKLDGKGLIASAVEVRGNAWDFASDAGGEEMNRSVAWVARWTGVIHTATPASTALLVLLVSGALLGPGVALAAMETEGESALAAPADEIEGSAAADPADSVVQPVDVQVGGVVVLRLWRTMNGYPPLERASIVYNRLWDALLNLKDRSASEEVRVVDRAGTPAIYVGPYLIVTVDAAHGRINRSSLSQLAETWARNLRRALQTFEQAQSASIPGGG